MAPTRKRPTARARIATVTAAKSTDPRGKYAPLPIDPATASAGNNASSSNDALSNLKDDYFGFDSASGFRISKKDKRTIKHGQLLNKVREAGISKAGANNGKNRRRPAKKLKTDISDLGDALPDVSDDDSGQARSNVILDGEDEWEGMSEDEEEGASAATRKARKRRRKAEGDGKMVMKSLKHRPGAMKKRKVLEERERERFGRNLAQLVKTEVGGKENGEADKAGCAQTQKWAALRAFIGSTMQQDKAFAAK